MRRFKLGLWVLIGCCSLVAWAQAWTLTPGRGVGLLTLDMSPEQASAQMKVTEVIGTARSPKFVRYGEDVLIQYEANRAVMITLNKPVVATKAGAVQWVPFSGAGIGVPWMTAEAALGRGYIARDLKVASTQPKETYYAYTKKGLGFRVKAGQIVQVDIFSAR